MKDCVSGGKTSQVDYTRVPHTLCVVIRNDGAVLLGRKKRGFGMGKWNGFGGKVRQDEYAVDAAYRELSEEAGILAKEIELVATLDFIYEKDARIHEVRVYKVASFTGEPVETEEMRPEWFSVSRIPYADMWQSDSLWLPQILAGRRMRGVCTFDDDLQLVRHALVECEAGDLSGSAGT